ncbi:Protein CBG25935 [Caenorhabditis briggsae]|nr:Protein CBG25935 [Caenorhabditis briggsae]CAS00297.1 Protein CBG25935 [Caenorhabditis briggsae]
MNRLVLDDELETLADAELEKADYNAIVMKNPKFEAIRDVDHAANVTSFMTNPGRTKFACINKQCATTNDPWILVTNIP